MPALPPIYLAMTLFYTRLLIRETGEREFGKRYSWRLGSDDVRKLSVQGSLMAKGTTLERSSIVGNRPCLAFSTVWAQKEQPIWAFHTAKIREEKDLQHSRNLVACPDNHFPPK